MDFVHFPVEGRPGSHVVLIPKSLTPLYVKGKVGISQLDPESGPLVCLGWHFDDLKERTIFSPRGSSLLGLEFKKRNKNVTLKSSSSKHLDVLKSRLENLVSSENAKLLLVQYSEAQFVCVLLSKRDSIWSDRLEGKMKFFNNMSLLGRDNALSLNIQPLSPKLEQSLNVNLLFGPSLERLRCYEENPSWALLLHNKEFRKTIVLGGKGVGKSTFLRYFTNHTLSARKNSVLYIDLDPGQAEFSMPGCVSATIVRDPILGPNFCHQNEKLSVCFYMGEVNMSNCPKRYLECIRRIEKFCSACEEMKDLPWVINSMGFTTGLGLHLLEKTFEAFLPTAAISVRSKTEKRNYPAEFEADLFARHREAGALRDVIEFDAVPESLNSAMCGKNLWGIPEPRKLRDLVVLANLAAISPTTKAKQVSWADVVVQVLFDDIAFHDILQVLDRSLVAIGKIPDDWEMPEQNKTGLRLLSHYEVVETVGFGIVFSVDKYNQTFSIMTSISMDILRSTNCLTIGAIKVPEAIHLDGPKKNRPYNGMSSLNNPLCEPWQKSSKPKANFSQ